MSHAHVVVQNSAFDLKTATLAGKLDSRFEVSRGDGSH